MKTFRELTVWQRAHALVLEIYKSTEGFPRDEKFGLVSQIRRSASSVPSNIAEGHKKRARKEYLRFLSIAECSLEETKYHLLLSRDLGYLAEERFEDLSQACDEVSRMLSGLSKSLSLTPYNLSLTASVDA